MCSTSYINLGFLPTALGNFGNRYKGRRIPDGVVPGVVKLNKTSERSGMKRSACLFNLATTERNKYWILHLLLDL